MRGARRLEVVALLVIVFADIVYSQHTFSIVAVDTVSGELGGAGATCLDTFDCNCPGAVIINGIVPGKGVAHAQAQVCVPNVNLQNALRWIDSGLTAVQVLDSLFARDACPFGDTANRQYGIITVNGGRVWLAGFTGSGTLPYAAHRIGNDYVVLGNILLGPEVLDSIEAGFRRGGSSLAERLMAALLAASRIVGADRRCLADSVSSLSAFLRVARPTDTTPYINLVVSWIPPGIDPIDSLYLLYRTLVGQPTGVHLEDNGSYVPARFYLRGNYLLIEGLSSGACIFLFTIDGRLLSVATGSTAVLPLPQGVAALLVQVVEPVGGVSVWLVPVVGEYGSEHRRGVW